MADTGKGGGGDFIKDPHPEPATHSRVCVCVWDD